MVRQHVTRKLAAVLAADVAGLHAERHRQVNSLAPDLGGHRQVNSLAPDLGGRYTARTDKEGVL